MRDTIYRQAAIDALRMDIDIIPYAKAREYARAVIETVYNRLEELPSAQPVGKDINVPNNDTISRAAAIDAIDEYNVCGYVEEPFEKLEKALLELPSAQQEQRCVNCGRTANNGGWYKDGRTRCPIEEHYALPKDGYCHLWEKRKVWEDDYVERPEEGEK